MERKIFVSANRLIDKLVVLVLMATSSFSVAAVNISEAEWLTWPAFCKAGFLASDWSRGSPFAGKMSEAQVRSIRSTHEMSNGIPGVHHFCIGMVYINRAKVSKTNPKNPELLRNAINDIEYSFSRISPGAPKYSLVTAHYGTALYLSGKRQQAFEIWEKGISTRPESRESYLAMAEALLKEKKPIDALEVLKRYESAKTTETPDAEAFLAFTYIELGQYDKAREHADNAYKLGYPLPGLRSKLERMAK